MDLNEDVSTSLINSASNAAISSTSTPTSTSTSTPTLSLFDQLKNSISHNISNNHTINNNTNTNTNNSKNINLTSKKTESIKETDNSSDEDDNIHENNKKIIVKSNENVAIESNVDDDLKTVVLFNKPLDFPSSTLNRQYQLSKNKKQNNKNQNNNNKNTNANSQKQFCRPILPPPSLPVNLTTSITTAAIITTTAETTTTTTTEITTTTTEITTTNTTKTINIPISSNSNKNNNGIQCMKRAATSIAFASSPSKCSTIKNSNNFQQTQFGLNNLDKTSIPLRSQQLLPPAIPTSLLLSSSLTSSTSSSTSSTSTSTSLQSLSLSSSQQCMTSIKKSFNATTPIGLIRPAALLDTTTTTTTATTTATATATLTTTTATATTLGTSIVSGTNLDNINKKKRCTDRYDSSESSDSGVATLSCTDSSTGSSEDVEPGSPFSPQTILSEDALQQSQSPSSKITKRMPPQTLHVSNNQNKSSATNATTTATTNVSLSNNMNATASIPSTYNTPVVTPTTNCNNLNNNSTAKTKTQTMQQARRLSTGTGTTNLPTLQWPWNTTQSAAAPATSTPSGVSSNSTSPTVASTAQNGKKRNAANTPIDSAAKKSRGATNQQDINSVVSTNGINGANSNGAIVTKRLKAAALEESQTKITGYFKSQIKPQIHQNGSTKRTETPTATATTQSASMLSTNSLTLSTPATTASLNKYFNILSQLENNVKNREIENQTNKTVISTSAALSVSSTSLIATTTTTSAATTTAITAKPTVAIVPPPLLPPPATIPMPALKKIERSKPTKIAQVAPNLRKQPSNNSNSAHYASSVSGKSPAKKHVAIAPRTPEMKQQQQQAIAAKANNTGDNTKSMPTQSPTSAAPNNGTATTSISAPSANQSAVLLTAIRLPTQATQQQQLKSALTSVSQASSKLTATTSTTGSVTNVATTVAPAQHNPTLFQLPTAVQLPNLVQLPQLLAANGANIMQLNNVAAAAAAAKSAAAAAAAASTTAAATSAQAAQAAAAQYFLNGTVFKLQQFTTATTTTATSAVAAATSASAATSHANPFNLMSASDFQELLLKQQQQQQIQQLQQAQQQQKVATATPANFQEIFQQQIAAAIAANQQQQQQQQFQQLQRLGAAAAAAANIQQQPVFMATPAGLLLNAASLPAMLAQAAAALAVNTNQQHQQKTVATAMHQQQLPALQPIQPQPLPALSSIFTPSNQQHQQQQETHELQQQQFQQQQQQLAHLALAQQQFITATQPPPLSAVSINNTNNNSNNANNTNAANINNSNSITTTTNNNNTNNNNTAITAINNGQQSIIQNGSAKLAIVKASAALAPRNNSQPPPLVTISNTKTTVRAANANNALTSKCNPLPQLKPATAALAKPNYQKRASKVLPTAKIASNSNKQAKVTTPNGKIIATPTTPPPLVPALPMTTVSSSTVPTQKQHSIGIASKDLTNKRFPAAMNAAAASKLSNLPTPALVSIAPATATVVKLTQSTASAATTTAMTTPSLTALQASAKSKSMSNLISTPASAIIPTVTTSIETAPAVTSTPMPIPMANTSKTPDLFDLVKNSNGAISITSTCKSNTAATTVANCFDKYPVASITLTSFSKIKEEPLEDNTNSSQSSVKLEKSAIIGGRNCNSNSSFGNSNTSNSLINSDIKMELLEDSSTKLSTALHHEYSSSSFSSHSNSVSSAADLSLDASTPPSLSMSSPSQSPAPSTVTSPTHKPHHHHRHHIEPPTPPSAISMCDSNSNPFGDNGVHSTHASNQDMLSEMVTSSCISSDSLLSQSTTASAPTSKIGKLISDDDEKEAAGEETDIDKRNLPTPADSGIGGSISLSNSESSNSIGSTINSTLKTSQIDSPPPTPSGSNSSSIGSNSCSPGSDNSSVASSAPSPVSALLSENICSPNLDSLNLFSLASPDVSNTATMETTITTSSAASISSANSTYSTNTGSNRDSYTAITTATTIDTQLAEAVSAVLPKSAISPILSQPKTIRFPADSAKNSKRHDGVCYWHKCNQKHDSSSKLLDHMQSHHVNSQTGPFSCLWVGCKVYNKESCSRRWLERHVLSHGGSKQFKCIVEGCGIRFASQLALQKHVNNHFTATENKESNNKRTSDPPVPKQLRKNGKKLRYRRQPFSARMFDFFDTGIMEGIQHRLRQISVLTNGTNSITFRGECMMRRRTFTGIMESYVCWTPRDIIANEWLPESNEPYTKVVNIKKMKPTEKTKVEALFKASYKQPYSPNLFFNNGIEEDIGEKSGDESSIDNDEDNYDDDEAEENSDSQDRINKKNEANNIRNRVSAENLIEFEAYNEVTIRKSIATDESKSDNISIFSSSSQRGVLSVASIESQPRKKHPRKPQKQTKHFLH